MEKHLLYYVFSFTILKKNSSNSQKKFEKISKNESIVLYNRSPYTYKERLNLVVLVFIPTGKIGLMFPELEEVCAGSKR